MRWREHVQPQLGETITAWNMLNTCVHNENWSLWEFMVTDMNSSRLQSPCSAKVKTANFLSVHGGHRKDRLWVECVALRPEGVDMSFLYLGTSSSCIGVPADSPQVNWWICSHKDVSPIICKPVVNDSSCEAGMHHFQADLSLTSHSRVLLIQIYIWQDTLWAYIKWIRTPLGHSGSIAKWKRRH